MLKAILIDDEPDNIKLLALQLRLYCPSVEVIAECSKSEEGLLKINELNPDLVFLDIEMPRMNGFELLEKVNNINFALVFVTAYDKFAVKAFKYSAVDYLLKPIDTKELQEAIKKIENNQRTEPKQVEHLKQQFKNSHISQPDKIALPYQNGVTFVAIADIVYCEADDNYTKFVIRDGQSYLVSKTMRDIQEILEEREFLRVHRQFIINLNLIKKYVKGEGNYVIMLNEKNIPIARNQKEKLVQRFGWL
jgi:two-component system, LytTR family, response regulator